jgi:hypothetical protein
MNQTSTNYKEEIRKILDEKNQRLSNLKQRIKKINRLKSVNHDSNDNLSFSSSNESNYNQSKNFDSNAKINLDLARNEFYLNLEYKKIPLSNSKFTSMSKDAETSSLIKQAEYKFFRIFKYCTIFYFYFPCLLYSKDLKDVNTKSFRYKLIQKGSFINNFLNSLTGILGAWLITLAFNWYIKNQLRLDSNKISLFLLVFFIIMLFGLSFNNKKFRCIILLIIPFFATNRGRSFFLMRCIKLVMTIIIPNIFNNLRNLSFAFICNRSLLFRLLGDAVKHDDFIQSTIETFDRIQKKTKKIEKALITTKRALKRGMRHVKKAYKSAKSLGAICSVEMGKTYQRCLESVHEILDNCPKEGKLGTILSFFLNPIGIFKIVSATFSHIVCYIFKNKLGDPCLAINATQKVCVSTKKKIGSLTELFEEKVEEEWDSIVDNVIDPFINQFKFNVDYNVNKTSDSMAVNAYKTAASNISLIYQQRIEYIGKYSIAFDFVFPISFLFIIYSAFTYHRKYLKRDKYQNYIIGPRFHELDEKMTAKKQQKLLPLNPINKIKYVDLFDVKLSQSERRSTFSAIQIVTIILLPVLLSILFDKFLAYLNILIVENTLIELNMQTNSVKARENGLVTSIYKALFDNINRQNSNISFSNKECMPIPQITDNFVYETITTNIILIIILACFQEYIKRWRSVLAGCIYPERDQERTVWLYNQIKIAECKTGFWLKKKNDSYQKQIQIQRFHLLLKLKELILKFFYFIFNLVYVISMNILCFYCFCTIDQKNLSQFIYHHESRIIKLYLTLFKSKEPKCINCLKVLYDNQNEHDFIKCKKAKCKGLYCIDCFNEMDNLCKLCNMVLLDQDLETNESMEKDSSKYDSNSECDENENKICLNYLNELLEHEVKKFEKLDSSSASSSDIDTPSVHNSNHDLSNINYELESNKIVTLESRDIINQIV